ncbi:MAG: N-acetylmuramoyl-L-alanine amidase [Acidaminococcaceae bacterium]|nr:N-acetylmuramoyl-L-alanine amidase [Acidaminococcaceae bacterium]
MKKFLLAVILALLPNIVFASVTDVKWGEDVNKVLRLVFDLTEPANFDFAVEKQTLTITVDTAFEKAEKTDAIRSEYAKSMYVHAVDGKTVLRLPLVQELVKEDVKAFTLKQDPVTKRPSRIVFDIAKKPAVLAAAPKSSEFSSSTTVASTAATTVSVATASSMAPGTAASSTPVVSKTTTSAPTVSVRSSAPATTSRPPLTSGTPVVGNSPTNRSAAQQQAIDKGREEVAEILNRVKGVKSAPVITDSAPVNTGKTEVPPQVKQAAQKVVEKVAEKAVEKAKTAVTSSKGSSPVVQIISSAAKGTAKAEPQEKVKPAKKSKKGEYRTKGGIKGKIITIDPGHGGSDPGAVSDKGTYEKTITLAMAKKLKADLEKMGAVVYLTRSGDTDVAKAYADDEVELQARVNVAEKKASDLFISLHINASVNKKASGISTYYYPKTNYDTKLAKCIHKQLTTNFKLNDMGAREANFYVIKRCYMPAVLMELGFITNKKEEKTISGNWFQNKAMGLVADGIKDYFK